MGSVASYDPLKKGIPGKSKPKWPQAVHIYSVMYFKAEVKPLVAAHWVKDEGRLTASGKLFTHVVLSTLLTKELWEVLLCQVKDEVEKECQICGQVALAKYKSECEGAASVNPQYFQIAIEHIYSYLQEVATVMTSQTGFSISILARGPLPITNSEIVTSHVHKGQILGTHPLNFGSYAHDMFDGVIMPKFNGFLHQAFLRSLMSLKSNSLKAAPDVAYFSEFTSSESNTPTAVPPVDIETSDSCEPELSDHGSEDKDAVFYMGHHSTTQPGLNVVSNGTIRAIAWGNAVILTRSAWICSARKIG
ncbi:hypothetical protein BS47DRAFT_1360181 [Hydnum rufescens UP504]|uniref:Uncharacterized protein n=1 Tax=Hydnum rufescens UP504 TaxID=1448309 RepID=A0A9P6DZA4_9AGAM|nr:hypothetical protein BS47DRAFT_1360181 [Hydnum rufescens UP504]